MRRGSWSFVLSAALQRPRLSRLALSFIGRPREGLRARPPCRAKARAAPASSCCKKRARRMPLLAPFDSLDNESKRICFYRYRQVQCNS